MEELEIIKFNNFVDKLDDVCGLTLFQIAFIKEVKYFNEIQGSFKFIKTHYVKKYEEVITEKQMQIDIDELLTLGLVRKDIKKTIYNGKFSTIITFTTSLTTNIGFWTGFIIDDIKPMLGFLLEEFDKVDIYSQRLIAIDIYMISKTLIGVRAIALHNKRISLLK
jgi:hypothetical protein